MGIFGHFLKFLTLPVRLDLNFFGNFEAFLHLLEINFQLQLMVKVLKQSFYFFLSYFGHKYFLIYQIKSKFSDNFPSTFSQKFSIEKLCKLLILFRTTLKVTASKSFSLQKLTTSHLFYQNFCFLGKPSKILFQN